MSEDKFNRKQKTLLLRAQKVINGASLSYVSILKQHIDDLKISLECENLAEAIQTCHSIQSQAGTFGWSLAAEISDWFRKYLETQQESGVNVIINKLFLNSLNSIVKDNLKGKSDTAIKLLQHIETVLKKEQMR